MRALLAAVLVSAAPGLASDRLAALQLCLQLPEGLTLFSDGPTPLTRQVARDTWMLDFELTINGHAVERITRSGPDCLRAWLPAEKVKTVACDFARLPLNLATVAQPLTVQLKPDLWSDGGRVVVERVPWATAKNLADGELVLERSGAPMRDFSALPMGSYLVKFTPAPPPIADCPITLQVTGVGTVRPDRNPALYRELVELYRADLLPQVIKRHKLQCDPAEEARVMVALVDGIFREPLSPRVERVRVTEKEPRYQLVIDGQVLPYVEGLRVTVGPGQHLEFSRQHLQAAR